MVVSEAVLILKMRTYPSSFAASLVTFDKALTPLNILWNFLHQVFGENSHLRSDRTKVVEIHLFYCFCRSNRQAKQWAISTITNSSLGKCEKSLNLENGSPILDVGL